jgi:uncharacterized protein DUF6361
MALTPYLSWLDHSETDRRRALDIIHLFHQQDTVDELGIGVIRDAFADMLFPGISTIQTRARYFLFIAWIYVDLERRRIRSAEVAIKARKEEIKLIFALLESDDTDGVIGKDVKTALKRLPSDVYWSGLAEWGLRLFPGSQEQYHRYLDRHYASSRTTLRTDDGDPAEGTAYANWHPGIPSPPPDFPSEASFQLSRAEAEYLKDRIIQRHPRTLLAFLVSRARPTKSILFPWNHPQYGDFPPDVTEQLDHARDFSEAMHGAALLYNLMLSEAAKLKDHQSEFELLFNEWAGRIESRRTKLRAWDRDRFWQMVILAGGRVPGPTRTFIEEWIGLVLSARDARRIVKRNEALHLIAHRELELKGRRARLHNDEALHRWGGASGSAQLSYRWPVAETITNDILSCPGVDAGT